MNELKSVLKHKKPNPVKDSQGLTSLLNLLNDNRVTGAQVPKGTVVNPVPKAEFSGVTAPDRAAPVVEEPTPLPPAASQGPVASVSINKVVFSGRMMSGKDFSAEAAGLKIFSLAEPLYALQALFFGTADKTAPGAREFLQTAGQIGRGEISAALPLSIERASFAVLVRDHAYQLPDDFSVDWSRYGGHQDLWLDAMLLRVNRYLANNLGARVAVTNARFSNELTRLTAEGFVHFHAMTSAGTWTARLQKVGLLPESPACKDVSEHLAASLDQNVIKTLSGAKHGPKLRCVWSDEKMSPPSGRLLTVSEFCAMFPK